jgi:hypothetical protein
MKISDIADVNKTKIPKWETTGDMRKALAEQLFLLGEGKASPKEVKATLSAAKEVNAKLKKQNKEMEQQIKDK